MAPRWLARAFGLTACAALAGAGCGGDDDGGSGAEVNASAAAPDGATGGSDAGDPSDAAPGGPELEVGSSDPDGFGYVAIAAGGDIPLHAGIQGGHHIWNGFRVRRMSGTVTITHEVRRASDDQLMSTAPPFDLEIPPEAETGWWESPDALRHILCPGPVAADGVEVIVHVQLDDGDGHLIVGGNRHVVPRCPDPPVGCDTDCGG